MYMQESVLCSMWLLIWVFVCFIFLPRARTNTVGFDCPWPAFNCQVDDNQQSFPLSRELRATRAVSRGCSNLQWTCRTGQQCIAASSRCNGIPDCRDGSDEQGCQGVGFKTTIIKDMKKSQKVVKAVASTHNTRKDNCTLKTGPAQERFCRHRYRGYFKHMYDCEKYIVCEWGSYYECRCPTLTRWDMRLVTCIWKFMSPCFVSDTSPTNGSSAMHPGQIARLIDLYNLDRSMSQQQQQTVVRSQMMSPRMRKVNQTQRKQSDDPGQARNRTSDQIQTQYDGNVLGSVVQ